MSEVLDEIERLRPDLVKLAQELVRVPSVNPPGDETAAAEVLGTRLKELGLDVTVHEAAPRRVNLCALRQGRERRPVLLFNGHTDVVPVTDEASWSVDPFSGAVVDGKLFGRGAADMKGALASITTAMQAVVNLDLDLVGDVVFHAVADEEVTSRYGTRYLIERGLVRADMGLVAEGSVFAGRIAVRPAVRGTCWIRLRTIGKAAHASRPERGVNAVVNMARLLLALNDLDIKHKPHRHLPAPTLSPGTRILGGVKTNIIPHMCEADCDIRTVPGTTARDVIEQVEALIQELNALYPNFAAETEVEHSADPAEIDENEPIVGAAKRAVKTVVGYEPDFRGGWGSNDAQYLINQAGIPTLCGFGPGDHETGNAHGVDENVDIQALVDFAKIYALMILEICRVASER